MFGIFKNKRKLRLFALLLPVLILFSLFPAFNAYAVFVSPLKVVFLKNQKTATLTINNRGKEPQVVTFEWERRAITPDGETVLLKEGETVPNYMPADPYLKFSPRRTIIQPGQGQVIRLIAMRAPNMAPGEYRSNILIKEEPLEPEKGSKQTASTKKKELGGSAKMRTRQSVPVYLRSGETGIDLKFTSAVIKVEEKGPFFYYQMSNNSTRTIYTTLRFDCQMPDGTMFSSKGYFIAKTYPEQKNPTKKVFLQDFPAKQCKTIVAKLVGYRDSHYGKKVIDSVYVSIN